MGKQRFFAVAVVGVALSAFGLVLTRTTGLAQSGSDDKPSARASSKENGDGKSNEQLSQPKLIEHSYPLAGDQERGKSVRLLQQLTVDLLAIDNIYKEAHWNLSGPLYLQLHEYYDQQATFYHKQADDFAERVLHLGYSVDGRYATIARTTTIPEFPAGYLTDNVSLRLLVDRVTVLQKEIYKGIRETEQSDPPTSNRLQDLAYGVDKNLWQLRIHLQEPGGLGANLPWSSQQGHARVKK
jgi:starvation-inducible DNA-binding protein